MEIPEDFKIKPCTEKSIPIFWDEMQDFEEDEHEEEE